MRRLRVTNASLILLPKALFMTKTLLPDSKSRYVMNASLPVIYEALSRGECFANRTLLGTFYDKGFATRTF